MLWVLCMALTFYTSKHLPNKRLHADGFAASRLAAGEAQAVGQAKLPNFLVKHHV